MVLAKVGLPTALPTVRQLIGDVKRTAREVGITGALDGVIQSLDSLDDFCGRKSLELEVVLLRALPPEAAERLAAWLAEGFPVREIQGLPPDVTRIELPGGMLPLVVSVRSAAVRVSQRAGTPRPPVLVVLASADQPVTEDDRVNLERSLEDRPHVVIAANAADPTHKELVQRAKALAWTCEAVDLSRLPEKTLQARLGTDPWDGMLDALRATAASAGLESVSTVLTMVLDQQMKELKVKKTMAQQKLGKFQQKPAAGAGAAPDVMADVKTRLTRQFAEFERGAGDRLLDLVAQPTGTLTRELEGRLALLQELDHEQKTTQVVTHIPRAYEDDLNRLIRERVAAHCAADLTGLNDLFRMLGQEIERAVAQAGGPPIVVHFHYMTDDRVRRILDQYAYVQAQYRGELPTESFGDYFGDVRKYSMLLVMGASMFGVSSYLRMYREIVIPVTITLVAFGTYHVYTSTKQTRIENQEKEQEAARNSLRPEIKRVLNDVQKQWSSTLSQYLQEQQTAVLAEVDAQVKDYAQRKGSEGNPEKDRLQRQLLGLDATEKRFLATGKARETAAAAIPQIRADLRPLVVASAMGTKPPMAAGAAAGAVRPGLTPGAVPRPGLPGAAARAGVPAAAGAGITVPRPVPKPLEPAAPAAPPRDMSAMRAKLAALKAKRTE